MIHLPFHRHESLRRLGVTLMVAGGVAMLLPAPPADGLASAHEILALAQRHLWWQVAGSAALVIGNMVRLIGEQGHPGLPWPLLYRGMAPELAAIVALRRRAWENRMKALGAVPAGAR